MTVSPMETDLAHARNDLRDAYERGRADEKAARKRHPLGMTLLVVAALVGVVLLALAAFNGSFGRAGGVVDQNISAAAVQAEPAARDAAAAAGSSVRDAGQAVREKIDRTN